MSIKKIQAIVENKNNFLTVNNFNIFILFKGYYFKIDKD